MRMFSFQLALCAAVLALHGSAALAQSTEEDELALVYGNKSQVSIATGAEQALARAPAVASVITAEDIRAMGATGLDQVLESVPGFHVSVAAFAYSPIFSVRGVGFGLYNPQVLVLLDGVRTNFAMTGGRAVVSGNIPIENIARVEVIRGPGSALYGADAFAGVINIVSKSAAEINGTVLGLRAGSANTRDGWLQYGGYLGPLQAAFYLHRGRSDGADNLIEKDAQSALDPLFGSHASLAPGPLTLARKEVDLSSTLTLGDWRLHGAYQGRESGSGAGLAESLDPSSRAPETQLQLDLSYRNANWAKNWDVSAQLGFLNDKAIRAERPYMLYPPGAFGGAFPQGMLGDPSHYERQTHASASAFYSGWDGHRVRVGSGYRIEDLYYTAELKNFAIVALPGVGPVVMPLGRYLDASADPALLFLQPQKRYLAYGFLQDEWRLTKDWTLTVGVRTDHYSDFGSTTNPRLALVWDAAYNLVIKLMHGQAFRAPAFNEQYSGNNPVNIGNPTIRPETMATDEVALAWQATTTLQATLNLFHYRMNDIIRLTPNPDPSSGKSYQNAGDQIGNGLELETRWDASRALRLSGSLSLQHSRDGATGQDSGVAPRRRLFARADWALAPQWMLGGTVNAVADRQRQAGDLRAPVANYVLVDLNLRREKIADHCDVRVAVRNLFDRDAREPSLAPGNIPFDLPLARRSVSIELAYTL